MERIAIDHPLRPDALDANRRGVLGDAQRQAYGRVAQDRRKSELGFAVLFAAGGLLFVVFASSVRSHEARVLGPVIGLAIAALLVAHSVVGSDALTRDLRAGEVRSIEGPIGKSYISGGRGYSSYFLDVGQHRFVVAHGTYEAAPATGQVRAYYLPRSRKVVNLECVTEVPLGRRDSSPLAQAIAGTWSNGVATVTFAPGGSLAVNVEGRPLEGHWWVDTNERLHADLPGVPPAADASVIGDQLTIGFGGIQGMSFRRTG